MRHLLKVLDGVDVVPLMSQLSRFGHLWNANTARTQAEGTPFADVDDIWLRYPDVSQYRQEALEFFGEPECIFHPAWAILSHARPIIHLMMARMDAYALDRVLITRLPSGGVILNHNDGGNVYSDHPDRVRLHAVLQGYPGNWFHNGGQSEVLKTGEVWAFNPRIDHSVENDSPHAERIHMIVDMRVFP